MRIRSTPVLLASLLAASLLAACSPKQPEPTAETTPVPTAPAADGSFKIGELSAFALRDGAFEFPNDNKIFGVGHTTEEVAAVLTAAGLPADKMSLDIQPLLVKAGDRTLLFDTGAGANFGAAGGKLVQSLAEAGLDADGITDIFISHAHGDHIGGLLNAEGKLAFPNATVHLGAADWAFVQSLTPETGPNYGIQQPAAFVAALAPKIDAFAPGAELIPGVVKAVEIRGHTPGHSGYLIGSGADSVLYIGDTMHHFVISVQKPDWTVAFDGDAPTAEKSRGDVLAQSVANNQRIYAVHFPYPGVGRFERSEQGYVWKAE